MPLTSRKRVLISGPYGGLNIGDDAIAESLINRVRSMNIDVSLASISPQVSKKLFPKVNDHRFRLNLRRPKKDAFTGINNTDCIIIGGGQQLAEPRIKNPIWGHLAATCQQILLAKALGKRAFVIGIGAPSKHSTVGRLLLRFSFRLADLIIARDEDTQIYLSKILKRNDIELGADPVFSTERLDKYSCKKWLKANHGIDADKPTILLIPANDKIIHLRYLDEINKFIKEFSNEVQFIYFCTDLQKDYDQLIRSKKMLRLNPNCRWFDSAGANSETLAKLCSACELVISARMHGLIFSLTQYTPCISITRSNKMHTFCKESSTVSLPIKEFSHENLSAAYRKTLDDPDFNMKNDEYLSLVRKRENRQFELLKKAIFARNGSHESNEENTHQRTLS